MSGRLEALVARREPLSTSTNEARAE